VFTLGLNSDHQQASAQNWCRTRL